MNLTVLKTPVARFLLQSLILLVAWYAIYDLWLHPLGSIDIAVIQNVSTLSIKALTAMGYSIYTGGDRLLGIDGTNGIWIGDNCNGLSLFALFAIIIYSYPAPGKGMKKFLFIIFGIITIHLFNIIRVIGIAIGEVYAFDWTNFNHNVTFKYLMYIYIFALWMWWVEKISGSSLKNSTITTANPQQ